MGGKLDIWKVCKNRMAFNEKVLDKNGKHLDCNEEDYDNDAVFLKLYGG